MQYQDISQVKELVVTKLNNFFSNSNIAKGVLIVLVILTAYYSLLIINLFFNDNKNSWQLPDINKAQINNKQIDSSDTEKDKLESIFSHPNNIQNSHLFGMTKRPGGSIADAIKSELPLSLTAVVADTTNPKTGNAIVKNSTGREKSYQINDKILIDSNNKDNYVTLEYIFTTRIYVDNNGVLEYIEYPVINLESNIKSRPNTGNNIFNSNIFDDNNSSSTDSYNPNYPRPNYPDNIPDNIQDTIEDPEQYELQQYNNSLNNSRYKDRLANNKVDRLHNKLFKKFKKFNNK